MFSQKIKKRWIWLLLGICSFSSAFAQSVSRRNAIVEVVEKTGQAIVNISTEQIVRRENVVTREDLFEEFFGMFQPRIYKTQSLGSGVIIDPEGFIVTNEHVIRRASKITIILQDKQRLSAVLLATDQKNDLALLKVNSNISLPHVEWGTSSDILIGETSIALGNPFGLQNTVTTGVISGTDRSLAVNEQVTFQDFIQTDAAINPGNSGGALLNIHGELIGLNTAIYAQGHGLGFAIPVDRVRKMLGKLLDYRQLKKHWLGIELEEIPRKNKNWLVKVASIMPNSPASRSQLSPGDYIIAVNNQPVRCLFDFNKNVYNKKKGETITIQAFSNNQRIQTKIKIASLPLKSKEKLTWERLGVLLKETYQGLQVVAIRNNSAAQRIGIQEGDIIFVLAERKLSGLHELHLLLRYIPSEQVVPISIRRGNRVFEGKILVE